MTRLVIWKIEMLTKDKVKTIAILSFFGIFAIVLVYLVYVTYQDNVALAPLKDKFNISYNAVMNDLANRVDDNLLGKDVNQNIQDTVSLEKFYGSSEDIQSYISFIGIIPYILVDHQSLIVIFNIKDTMRHLKRW